VTVFLTVFESGTAVTAMPILESKWPPPECAWYSVHNLPLGYFND